MTTRPVFTPRDSRPFYREEEVELAWAPGQAASQKILNSKAIQETWLEKHPGKTILEVSTKSELPLGQALSPFNLNLYIPDLHKSFPIENIYEASKVFKKGGPYVDLLGLKPAEARRDERLKTSGEIVHFRLQDKQFPADPVVLFYTWIYARALKAQPGIAKEMLKYDAYCDVEYNPKKGFNCQARACAIYNSLAKLNLLDQIDSFDDFKNLFLAEDITEIKEQSHLKAGADSLRGMRKLPTVRQRFSPGQWIEHPGIGVGKILRRTPDGYVISFKIAGPRTINKDYVEIHCKPATVNN